MGSEFQGLGVRAWSLRSEFESRVCGRSFTVRGSEFEVRVSEFGGVVFGGAPPSQTLERTNSEFGVRVSEFGG